MSDEKIPEHWLNVAKSACLIAAGQDIMIEVTGGSVVRRSPVAGTLVTDGNGYKMFIPDTIEPEAVSEGATNYATE